MNWQETLDQLEKGTVRSAFKLDGKWVANKEVKEAILAAFKAVNFISSRTVLWINIIFHHVNLNQKIKFEWSLVGQVFVEVPMSPLV